MFDVGRQRLLLVLLLVGIRHGLVDAESLDGPGCLVGLAADSGNGRLGLAGRGFLGLLFTSRLLCFVLLGVDQEGILCLEGLSQERRHGLIRLLLGDDRSLGGVVLCERFLSLGGSRRRRRILLRWLGGRARLLQLWFDA